MISEFRNFRAVPSIIFNKGAISELHSLINRLEKKSNYAIFIIDHFFENRDISKKIKSKPEDLLFYLNSSKEEPTVAIVDQLTHNIKKLRKSVPDAVVGIGGGSTMDVAKAVSIMLTNDGSAKDYQGWDLVNNKPVYKIGIPTLSGTGSEVSRTAVLISPEKKQGINSDYSVFNQIILDPDLLKTVPEIKKFYTGMDCYIHSVEALCGRFNNEFSLAFAEKSLELCRKVFLQNGSNADLMVASFLGGYSIAYSEVGVCHALSYGLSYAFGLHHGEANCIVFNYLDEYYPEYVPEFKLMLKLYNIVLPQGLMQNVDNKILEKMIDIALLMEKPLRNALGNNWSKVFTREKIKYFYLKI